MFLNKINIVVLFLLVCQVVFSQKRVAITIDDVPNTSLYEKENYSSALLKKLDSLFIPVAIFINEGHIYKGGSIHKNVELLTKWSKREYITLGNHTFDHSRYSITPIDSFAIQVNKGEYISRELSKKYNKPLQYFRFPYNDLGKDSLQQVKIKSFLNEKHYQITPFTIESVDWMYNYVYKYYLKKGKYSIAKKIGLQYVNKTLEFFEFFESLSQNEYGREINQIYLCHDNKLNADFLPILVNELKRNTYQFISLDEALTDDIYKQSNQYYKKWGVSWFYRWKTSQKARVAIMKQEPSTKMITELYEKIAQESKHEE